jgi:hypothetical protein
MNLPKNRPPRLSLILAALALAILALPLAACGGPAATAPAATSGSGATTAATAAPAAGFVFKYNGVTIAMHAKTAPILAALGKEKSYFEAESCAFQGTEKTFGYPSFNLLTYSLDGVDYVASLLILDDSVETPEGVCLGDSLAEIKAAYGDQYVQSLGLYTYESGKMQLKFLIENDKVASIEYVALAG